MTKLRDKVLRNNYLSVKIKIGDSLTKLYGCNNDTENSTPHVVRNNSGPNSEP